MRTKTSIKKAISTTKGINNINKTLDKIAYTFYDKNEKIEWSGYFRYHSYLFGKYLQKKYDNVCFYSKIPMIYTLEKKFMTDSFVFTTYISDSHVKMLQDVFLKCSKQFLIIPVVILMHQNILIIDTKNKEIELFDSYGDTIVQEFQKNAPDIDFKSFYESYIKDLKELMFKITKFSKFYMPVDFFEDKLEFQNLEITSCPKTQYKINAWGFCVIWAFLYVETRLADPKTPRNKVVQNMLEYFNSEIDDIIIDKKKSVQTYKNPKICKVIRGYTSFVYNLDKNLSLFKKIKILTKSSGKLISKMVSPSIMITLVIIKGILM